ncbi:hypothetical protein D3C74_226890 [compost metagenome]
MGITQRVFIQHKYTAPFADAPPVQVDHGNIQDAFIFVGLTVGVDRPQDLFGILIGVVLRVEKMQHLRMVAEFKQFTAVGEQRSQASRQLIRREHCAGFAVLVDRVVRLLISDQPDGDERNDRQEQEHQEELRAQAGGDPIDQLHGRPAFQEGLF